MDRRKRHLSDLTGIRMFTTNGHFSCIRFYPARSLGEQLKDMTVTRWSGECPDAPSEPNSDDVIKDAAMRYREFLYRSLFGKQRLSQHPPI